MLSQEAWGTLTCPLSSLNLSNIVWALPDLNAFAVLKSSQKYMKLLCRISGIYMNNMVPSFHMISTKGECILPRHKCHKTKKKEINRMQAWQKQNTYYFKGTCAGRRGKYHTVKEKIEMAKLVEHVVYLNYLSSMFWGFFCLVVCLLW